MASARLPAGARRGGPSQSQSHGGFNVRDKLALLELAIVDAEKGQITNARKMDLLVDFEGFLEKSSIVNP